MYLVDRCDCQCDQSGEERVSHNVSLDSTTHVDVTSCLVYLSATTNLNHHVNQIKHKL